MIIIKIIIINRTLIISRRGLRPRGALQLAMSDFKKLEIKRFPRVSSKDDKESAFWDKFKVKTFHWLTFRRLKCNFFISAPGRCQGVRDHH